MRDEKVGGHKPTADQPSRTEDIGRRIVAGLTRIGLASRRRAWSEGTAQGLTPTQGQILTILRRGADRGLRLTELAHDLAVAKPTATVAVQALERKGLVQKARPRDAPRVQTIVLTAAGQREAERAAGWSDFLLTATEELTPEEQEALYRGLAKLLRTLQRRGDIPISDR